MNESLQALENFDWEEHANYSINLIENPKIKKHPEDKSKIFSRAKYAQELYELYEGSLGELKQIELDTIVEGVIISLTNEIAIVDIGARQDIIVEINKEKKEYLPYFAIGVDIDIYIEKIEEKNGSMAVFGSISKCINERKKRDIIKSIGEPVAYLAKVKELIHGGYFVDIDGVECFMPGSLGGMNKLVDFTDLLHKEIYVQAINFSKEKNYIVVSHRDYLKTLVAKELSELVVGKEYTGFVTGTSHNGIFCEFNQCLSGLISKHDLDQSKYDFDNGLIKPGTEITFNLKEVNGNKTILSQLNVEVPIDIWSDVDTKYKVGSYVIGKITKVVKYGLFIELEHKISGLLHKSNFDENLQFEIGGEIDVKITKIDKENKKIDFVI